MRRRPGAHGPHQGLVGVRLWVTSGDPCSCVAGERRPPGARHHRSDEDVPGGHEIAAAAAEGVRGRTPSRNRVGISAGSASLTPTEVEPNELGRGWCAKDLGEEDDGGEESVATVPSRPWGRAEDPGGDGGERDRIHSILIGPDYGGYLRSPALVFIAVKRGR